MYFHRRAPGAAGDQQGPQGPHRGYDNARWEDEEEEEEKEEEEVAEE